MPRIKGERHIQNNKHATALICRPFPRPTTIICSGCGNYDKDDGHDYVVGHSKEGVYGHASPVHLCIVELHPISPIYGVLYVLFDVANYA